MPIYFHDTLQAALHEVRDDERSTEWLHNAYLRLVSRNVKNINIGHTLRGTIDEIRTKNTAPYDLYGDPEDWADSTAIRLKQNGNRAFDRQPDNHYTPIFWGLLITATFTLCIALRDTIREYATDYLWWMLSPLFLGTVATTTYMAYIAVLRRAGFARACVTIIPSMLVIYVAWWMSINPSGVLATSVSTSWHAIAIFIYFALAALVYWRRNELREQEADLDFVISPEEWEEEFVSTLYERGSLGDRGAKEQINQVHQKIERTGESPIDLWGNPVSYARALDRNPSLPILRQVILLGILTLHCAVFAWIVHDFNKGQLEKVASGPVTIAFLLLSALVIVTAYRAVIWWRARKSPRAHTLDGIEYFF
ncbi:hypothetical protein ACIP5Z_09355 [Rothia terrae]|uniref:hypothetical protein n=1 Tax=Rothia terrae TaxID=396015 RepID=UPI003807C8BC